MAQFIAPLKVAPGSEVRLSRDHDPGYTGERGPTRQAAALLAEGVELLGRLPGPARRPGHVRRAPSAARSSTPRARTAAIKHVMSGSQTPQAVEVRWPSGTTRRRQPGRRAGTTTVLWRLPGRPARAGAGGRHLQTRSHYERGARQSGSTSELLAAERMPAVAARPRRSGTFLRRPLGATTGASSGVTARGCCTSRPRPITRWPGSSLSGLFWGVTDRADLPEAARPATWPAWPGRHHAGPTLRRGSGNLGVKVRCSGSGVQDLVQRRARQRSWSSSRKATPRTSSRGHAARTRRHGA